MEIPVLTEHEVYMACYLTMHGWSHHCYGGYWWKEGVTQEVEGYSDKHKDWRLMPKSEFTLQEAFDKETHGY